MKWFIQSLILLSTSTAVANIYNDISEEIRNLNLAKLCGAQFDVSDDQRGIVVECNNNDALADAFHGRFLEENIPSNAPTPENLGLNTVVATTIRVGTFNMVNPQNRIVGYKTEYSLRNPATKKLAGTVTLVYDTRGKLNFLNFMPLAKRE